MSDQPANGPKSSLPLGLNVAHLVSGGSAAGLAVAGSMTLSQYKIDELQRQIAELQPVIIQQTKITTTQDAHTKDIADIMARLDRFDANQQKLMKDSDQTKVNQARIDMMEQLMFRGLPQAPVPPAGGK